MLAILGVAFILGVGLNELNSRPIPLLAADGPGALPSRFERISIQQLRDAHASRQSVLLLDVRHEKTFKLNHPQNAQNSPAEKFINYYNTLKPWIELADIVVVLCDSEHCPSADRVAFFLSEAGHLKVRVLQGGWKAYEASDLPVETGPEQLQSKQKESEAKR
jgi:3-mercaptopyruvate sulfurtransferase SseA